MEIISGEARSGKTQLLITKSIYEGIPILVKNEFLKKEYTKQANKILNDDKDPSRTFPEPIVLNDYLSEDNNYGRFNNPYVFEKGIFIDNLEDIFQSLLKHQVKIKAITTREDIIGTFLNEKDTYISPVRVFERERDRWE